MALGLGGQYLLLLKKEFLLAKRKPCSLVFQFILPLAFAIFLVLLRLLVSNENKAEKIYQPLILEPFTPFFTENRTEILYTPNAAKAQDIMNNVQAKLGSPYTGRLFVPGMRRPGGGGLLDSSFASECCKFSTHTLILLFYVRLVSFPNYHVIKIHHVIKLLSRNQSLSSNQRNTYKLMQIKGC